MVEFKGEQASDVLLKKKRVKEQSQINCVWELNTESFVFHSVVTPIDSYSLNQRESKNNFPFKKMLNSLQARGFSCKSQLFRESAEAICANDSGNRERDGEGFNPR